MRCQHWADLGTDIGWPGTVDDFVRLLWCVGAHCTCQESDQQGQGVRSCPAHQLLLDQRVLDHLVFARSLRDKFIASEWSDGPVTDTVTLPTVRTQSPTPPPRLSRWSTSIRHWLEGKAGAAR